MPLKMFFKKAQFPISLSFVLFDQDQQDQQQQQQQQQKHKSADFEQHRLETGGKERNNRDRSSSSSSILFHNRTFPKSLADPISTRIFLSSFNMALRVLFSDQWSVIREWSLARDSSREHEWEVKKSEICKSVRSCYVRVVPVSSDPPSWWVKKKSFQSLLFLIILILILILFLILFLIVFGIIHDPLGHGVRGRIGQAVWIRTKLPQM